MSVRTTWQSLTLGELEPKVKSRIDTEMYYKGAETMTNVQVIPEGGFVRSPGLKHIQRMFRQVDRDTTPVITTPNGGTGANANDGDTSTTLVTTTNISTIDPYIVVHYDLGSQKDIAFIDTAVAKLTTATNNTEFFIQVSTDDAAWTSVGTAIPMSTTSATYRRAVRGTYRYIRFARIGATDLGTDKVTIGEFNVFIESANLSNTKGLFYKFDIDQRYLFFFSDKNISIYRDGSFLADVRALEFTNDKLDSIKHTFKRDTTLLFQEDIAPTELARVSDTNWTLAPAAFENIPQYDYVPVITNPAVTLTPSAESGKITLTASAATFNANDVNQKVDGGTTGGGVARIISFTSTTVVQAIVEIPFYNTSPIASGAWELHRGWEDVWSTTRGYPTCGEFYEQRLVLAGFKSLPTNIAATRIDDFDNFDQGAIRDNDGFMLAIDKADPIVNLLAHNTLQIFTTGGELTIPQSKTARTTPDNINITSQTGTGSSPNLFPVVVDEDTIFVRRHGKSLGAFVFSDERLAYRSTNLSIFSSHLIKTPVDFAFRKTTNTEEASYLLIVNSDGELTFGCVLAEQQVRGFSRRTTDGLFINAAVDDTEMYAIVQREINGVTNKYIEKFDFSYYTDAATQVSTGLPTKTFTGLDHLEGKECRVRADGVVREDVTVVGGSVTLQEDVTELFEIGLNFNPTVTTMPFAAPQIVGDTTGKKKRVHQAYLRLYQTAGIRVNDNLVSFREFGIAGGGSPLDAPAPIYTGDKRIDGLVDWSEFGQVTITQVDPLPMTVLGITTVTKT